MITIAIASKRQDDRAAITALLKEQADFCIVSIGSDGYDALKSAATQRPDIIIMDFCMEDIDSLELAPIIRRRSPSTALIVLCPPDEQNEHNAAAKALRAGISGCLFRQDGFSHLVPSIRSVLYGGWYVSKSARNHAARCFSSPAELFPVKNAVLPRPFTPTETDIFYGIICGYTDREIAKALNIATGSLRNCINQVKKKTGLKNRTQITVYALIAGIMSIEKIKNGFYRRIENRSIE